MSTTQSCFHNIKIINFGTNEVVNFPIVRLMGTTEVNDIPPCQMSDPNVTVSFKNTNKKNKICPLNNKFKILLELNEGLNEFCFSFGCKSLNITIDFCAIPSEYTVMPLYVICDGHDGFFQAPLNESNDPESACERIMLCTKLLQCFTAEKLFENGLGRRTFNMEKCQIFKSKVKCDMARKMDQEELWQNIGRDIMSSSIKSEKRKYLAFLSCTRYNGESYTESMKSHQDLLNITEAYVALGGGGLALFGTACLYTWPKTFEDIISKFNDETLVDRTSYLDDSCYRGTLGSCFSTTFGSVLHELYHSFDLGHTPKGIMGRGFDDIYKFFTISNANNKTEEVLKTFLNQIEFKEEFEADKLSERLLNENKRKEYKVIEKFEDDDSTFLTKSCALILRYHKWFNSVLSNTYSLTYDPTNKCIRSTGGIRVVELRSEPDEMILHNWTFEGKVLKFSFQIPMEVFKRKGTYRLFIEDNWGNILKQTL